MSSFTDSYTTLRDLLVSNLTTRFELYDSYDLTNNDDRTAESGWGIAIGASSQFEDNSYVKINQDTNISIVITELVYGNEASASHRFNKEIELYNVKQTILNLISQNFKNLRFEGDEGVQFLFDDRRAFIYLSLNFNLRYNDTVTTNC